MKNLKKKLNEYAIKLIPEQFKPDIIRNHLNLKDYSDKIVFKLARSDSELEQVFKLVHDSYVEERYMNPTPTGMRIMSHYALPSTAILVAVLNEKVIATISIIRDNTLGLPIESIFDISNLRQNGTTIAEISSLTIKNKFRRHFGSLLFPLLNFTYKFSEKYFGVDIFAIGVHPKFTDFYKSILLFNDIENGDVKKYSSLNGDCPARGFFLDLRTAEIDCAAVYKNSPKQKNLYEYFFNPDTIRHLVAKKLYIFPKDYNIKFAHPPMSIDFFKRVVIEKAELHKEISNTELFVLENIYGQIHDERSILNFSKTIRNEIELRFDVISKALVTLKNGKTEVVKVNNISHSGMGIILNNLLPIETVDIQFKFNEFEIAHLEGKLLWRKQNNAGIILTQKDDLWMKQIKLLENSYIENLGRDRKKAA